MHLVKSSISNGLDRRDHTGLKIRTHQLIYEPLPLGELLFPVQVSLAVVKSTIEARRDIMHLLPPQTVLYTCYGRCHVVFSLHLMSCWIVLQRHRSACLRNVNVAVSKLDVVLILLPTVTHPMTSYTKRSPRAVTVTGVASHSTQRGQSLRETTSLER